MKEVSLILRSNLFVTAEEFKILDRHSCPGKIWRVIQRPTNTTPFLVNHRTLEYIFDPEALTIFCIVSRNILATWDTDITRHLGPNDEFHLKDSLFLRPYP